MKVIRPVTITDAMLVSSSVPETDYAAWSSGATYAVADRVIKGHVIWESLQASNTNHDPETDESDPPYWLEVGSTNRWRMFDDTVNSKTEASGSIVVDIRPGAINALGLVELEGSTVRVQVFDGIAPIFDETQEIDATPIVDWFDYFFAPYSPASSLVFEPLPMYLAGIVRITISGDGTVGCGSIAAGTLSKLGETLTQPTAGITDYSRKSTNDFGVTSIVRRAFAKRASMRIHLDNTELRRVSALLADLRSTPCLWIGADDTLKFSPLVVYGWYRDFQIEIPYADHSFCSIEIEGMI